MEKIKYNIPSTQKLKTIGVICDFSSAMVKGYINILLSGIIYAAKERNINVICFAGEQLVNSKNAFLEQRNVVYKLAGEQNIDCVIVVSNSLLSDETTIEHLESLCKNYEPLPIVSVGVKLNDIPSIFLNNKNGMLKLLEHLIDFHGYKKIAFIGGPKGHPDAIERFNAYKIALREHNIKIDQNLIFSASDFLPPSGAEAVREFINKRKLKPKRDFDCIVASNDFMAFGALEFLKEKAKNVPIDIPIVGFDDIEQAKATTPALTTVRQPIYKLGTTAVKLLSDVFQGKNVPLTKAFKTEFIQRQSCGCKNEALKNSYSKKSKTLPEKHRTQILKSMADSLITSFDKEFVKDVSKQLLDKFYKDLKTNKEPSDFLKSFKKVISGESIDDYNICTFHELLETMRNEASIYILNTDDRRKAENLWHQAITMLTLEESRLKEHHRRQEEKMADTLHALSREILTQDFTLNAKAIIKRMSELNLKACCIAIYEDVAKELFALQEDINNQQSDTSRYEKKVNKYKQEKNNELLYYPINSYLIMAYIGRRKLINLIPNGSSPFQTAQLLPGSILPKDKSYTLLTKSLFFRNKLFGYMMVDLDSLQGTLFYETLCMQISSALNEIILFKKHERAEKELKILNEIGRNLSDSGFESLFKKVYEQTKELINIDNFFIARYNEQKGKLEYPIWMYKGKEIKVPSDEVSGLISVVINNRKSLLIKDWDISEPLFKVKAIIVTERQRSWLGAPIIFDEKIIGVISVQNSKPNMYNENTQRLLETIANQTAIAIKNSYLYKESEDRATNLKVIADVGEEIDSKLSKDEILQTIITEITKQLKCNNCTCFFPEKNRDGNEVLVSKYTDGQLQVQSGTTFKINEGLVGYAYRKGQSVLCDNVYNNPHFLETKKPKGKYRSMLLVPVETGNVPIAIICADHDEFGYFNESDKYFLESIARHTGIALTNYNLIQELDRRKEEYKSLFEESIEDREGIAGKMIYQQVSHDTKNVLAQVVANMILIIDSPTMRRVSTGQKERLKKLVVRVKDNIDTIVEFIDLVGEETSQKKLYNINDLIDHACRLLSGKIEKYDIKIDLTQIDKTLPKLEVSRIQIIMAFINIIDNAIDALKEQQCLREIKISAKMQKNSPWVEIAFEDNGSGITSEDLGKLFEPFFSTKSKKGRGIGLLGTQRIIDAHNGKLPKPLTKVGKGTKFTIYLPLPQKRS